MDWLSCQKVDKFHTHAVCHFYSILHGVMGTGQTSPVWMGYMKTRCFLFITLLVCVSATIAEERDTRTVVQLLPQHRALVLAEMRQFLSGLQQISEALSRDDMGTVASIARALGSPMTQHMDPDLRQAIPEGFRKLGFSVHGDFDQIALDAEDLGDPMYGLLQPTYVG
jgi:hypothetical protein